MSKQPKDFVSQVHIVLLCVWENKVGEGTRKAVHEKTPLDHAAIIISTLASYLQMATV